MRAVLVALLMVWSAAAHGEPGGAPEAPSPIARPLVQAPGRCEASLVVEANLGVRVTGEPVSLAPDARCALTERTTVGVLHSARSLSLVDSGGGVCLTGEDGGCLRPYDGGGIEALHDLSGRGRAEVAARAVLLARSLEPFKPALRLGALLRLRAGRTALLLEPYLQLGLAHEDLGNRDVAAVPLFARIEIAGRVLIQLHTGVRGEVDGFGEKFEIPLALGLLVELTPSWDLALEAGFNQLLGPQNTFKQRHGALALTYRFGTAPSRPAGGSYTAR